MEKVKKWLDYIYIYIYNGFIPGIAVVFVI